MAPKTNIIIILTIGLALAGILIGSYLYSCQQIEQSAQRTLDFDAYKFLGLEQQTMNNGQ